MAGERQDEDMQERIAAGVAALVALTVAQMMNPGRTKPWTQQELIIALHRAGTRPKDIATFIGTTRQVVDPVLSRYRKSRIRDAFTSVGMEP